MARCAGCSAGGLESVSHSNTDCIHLTGTGTSLDPLIATVQVDPSTDTCLNCGPDGLRLIFDPASPATITCGPDGISVAGGGGGGGQKTVITVGTPGIVSFGNLGATPAALFATADYQGDGINDNVAIQAAIDFAAGLAGTLQDVLVLILPGIYLVNVPLDTKSVFISGTGNSATTAFYTATFLGAPANTRTISAAAATNLRLIGIQNSTGGAAAIKCQLLNELIECQIFGDANGADDGIIECEGFGRIQNSTCTSGSTSQRLLSVTGNITANTTESWMIDNAFVNGDIFFTGANGTPTAINIRGNFFTNSSFTMSGAGKNFSDFSIDDNRFQNSTITLKGDGSFANSFSNNEVQNGQVVIGSENSGVTSVFHWRVIGNDIECNNDVSALTLDTVNFSIISDNFIYRPFRHGISMVNCFYNNVIGNRLREYGAAPGNTYDGIHLLTSTENNVQSNKINSATGKYGINVVSGLDNLVTNNDLKASGLTASFVDTATGTITVAGNRL